MPAEKEQPPLILTRDELCRFLSDRFGVDTDQLDDEDLLFSDGLLDSFSMVELIEHLETVEEIKIGAMEVQLENLDSISRILRFVTSKTVDKGDRTPPGT